MGGRLQRRWGWNRNGLSVRSGGGRRWLAATGCVLVLASALAATSALERGGAGRSGASAGRSLRQSASATGHRGLAGPQAAAVVPLKLAPARRAPVSRLQRAEAAALSLARRRGRPVVVAADTTATSQVVAQPDGLLDLVASVFPTRVRVGGKWVPIDTALRRTSDGGFAPAVVATPLVFSGGGSGPLVRVTDPASGRTASVWWPGPLPAPAVAGSVAVYPGVLPGVDLRLEATGTGYNEVLVVRNAAAAANPALRSLSVRVQAGPGLVVADGTGSSLAVRDAATGSMVLSFGQPLMWDSSKTQPFALPATAEYAGSGRVTVVPVTYRMSGAGSAVVAMTPPAAALTGPGVRFPVFIDPNTGDEKTSYYAQVMHGSTGFTQAWTTSSGTTSQPNGVTEVGYCGYPSCVWYPGSGGSFVGYTDRDYFRFGTSVIDPRPDGAKATVDYVDFNIEEMGNSNGCTSQPSAVFSTTGGISSSTTWGGPQGSQIATASSNAGGSSSCPAGYVDFNSAGSGNGGLKTTLQNVATAGDSTVTLELRAVNEGNDLQYKAYKDNPTLNVYYNFPPQTPANLAVTGAVTCNSSMPYVPTLTPTLNATDKDNNPSPLNVNMQFLVDTSAGSSVASSGWKGPFAYSSSAGYSAGSWATPALTSGTAYKFQVQAENLPTSGDGGHVPSLTSGWSGWSAFTPLSAPAPGQVPTISSFDYPQGQWGQAAGAPGTFTVGTGGAADVAGFAYTFDGAAGSEPVPGPSDCTSFTANGGLGTSVQTSGADIGQGNMNGALQLLSASTAQIEIPAGITPGPHTLYVVYFDDAHNRSGEAKYTFYVPADYQTTGQPVTSIDPTTLTASGPNASQLVTQADCCGLSWRYSHELLFNGTAAAQSFTLTFGVPASATNGTWQLGAEMTRSYDFGQQQIVLDQGSSTPVTLAGTGGTPWDGYSATVSMTYLDLGTVYLTPGSQHTLTFTITGQTTGSQGFKTGISYLTLSPTNRYEGEDFAPPSQGSSCPSPGTPAQAGFFTVPSGQQAVPTVQDLTGGAWSDNGQLFLANSVSGASLTLAFDAPVSSDYALGVNMTTAPDYGQLQFTLDPATAADPSAVNFNLNTTAYYPGIQYQQPSSGPKIAVIDGYAVATSTRYVFLGGVFLAAGMHCLQVTVTGTNSASTGNRYNAGIDYFEAVPVTGPSYSNFTAAMNNLGIATDGASSFSGSFDQGSWQGDLSYNAMQTAGITPGSGTATGAAVSLNGAAFTMPQLKTDSSGAVIADNVIADGQTIQLPSMPATGVTDVALLVAATCWADGSPPLTATLGYSDGPASQPSVPSVPDWVVGPSGPAVIVLGHGDTGTAPNGNQPRLYEVILPANPNLQVATITLPVMPGSYLSEDGQCGVSPALHVLAVGTRTVAAPSNSVWTGAYAAPMDEAIAPWSPMGDETIREVLPVSVPVPGTGYVRVKISNAHSTQQVTFDHATIAYQASSAGTGTSTGTQEALTFNGGSASVTIPAGGDVYTDPRPAPTMPTGGTGYLTVSLHIAASTPVTSVPIHDTSNVVTYIASGDQTTDTTGTPFTSASSLAGLYYIAGIDVSDSTATDGTIAVLGDQTAAAAPAWTTGTWPSYLPGSQGALSTAGVPLPGAIADVSTSGTQPDHRWQMNGTSLEQANATAYDSGAGPYDNMTLGGTATWVTDSPPTGTSSGALNLDGSTGYAATSGQVIDTTGSFSVSAWVKLTSTPTHDVAVITQSATTDSAFYLDYEVSTGDWDFKFPTADVTNPVLVNVSGPAAVVGAWTHLTGVYDASTNTATLYVNGVAAGSATVTPIPSSGPLEVGRSLWNGGPADYLPGEISDVRVYSSRLWGTGVSQDYNDTGTDVITSANALTAFREVVTAEPNLRDVIVAVGANDVLEGVSAATIEQNLSSLVTAINGYYDTDYPALGHPQAILTTIPPLGLGPATSDPRENVREQVNSWIMGGNSCAPAAVDNAALSVDIACAVQAPGSPNLINPALLSGGVPTSSYYSAIATEFASEFNNAVQGFLINGL